MQVRGSSIYILEGRRKGGLCHSNPVLRYLLFEYTLLGLPVHVPCSRPKSIFIHVSFSLMLLVAYDTSTMCRMTACQTGSFLSLWFCKAACLQLVFTHAPCLLQLGYLLLNISCKYGSLLNVS